MTGPQLVEEIGKQPTLDTLLDRDPHAKPYTDIEALAIIEAARRDRALFTIKEEKAKAKREGIEEVDNG